MVKIKKQPEGLTFSSLGHLSWKSYNLVKKKAMEQEFSWSGLVVSLSIAFFIVLASAQGLSLLYQSTVNQQNQERLNDKKIYHLESAEWLKQNYLFKNYSKMTVQTKNYLI